MNDQLEALLHGSVEIARLRKQIEILQAENAQLRRYQGMARLMQDMRADLAEFELCADSLPIHDCMFFKRQI